MTQCQKEDIINTDMMSKYKKQGIRLQKKMTEVQKMFDRMKKKISMLLIVLLAFGITAFGSADSIWAAGNSGSADSTQAADSESSQVVAENKTAKDVLVVYFSATGTTKGVAEKIAAATDGDIYEIKAAQEYTDADLDWNDSDSRSTKEQNDSSVRPEIGSEPVSIDGYKTIYIGYPIWWGEEPRIMDTFVESCNFDGITMIPFCTSASSGIGRSGKNLADNAGSGNWLDGKRFGAGASEDDIQSWIESIQ